MSRERCVAVDPPEDDGWPWADPYPDEENEPAAPVYVHTYVEPEYPYGPRAPSYRNDNHDEEHRLAVAEAREERRRMGRDLP